MKVNSTRGSGISLTRTAVTVVAMVATLLVGAGYLPPQGASAQTVQVGSAQAASTVGQLAQANEESAVADVRQPSGIAEADTQATATRTATIIRRSPTRSYSSSRSSVSASGWRSAIASWYGPGFYGNTMASGQILTTTSMVVAHRTLPFGTRIEFSYKGRTCVAVVMDRGPYSSGRTFDLGPGTAKALGFSGVGTVQYRIL